MYIEMNPTGLTLSDLICVAHRKQSEYTCFANVKENVFHYRLRLAAEGATMAKTCFLDREHRARFQKALHRVRGNDKSLIAQLFVLTATESLWSASDDAVGKSSIHRMSWSVCGCNVPNGSLAATRYAHTLLRLSVLRLLCSTAHSAFPPHCFEPIL